MVCPYNGILLSNKREWTVDTCYNMVACQSNSDKWKKPDQREVYIHIKFQEMDGNL